LHRGKIRKHNIFKALPPWIVVVLLAAAGVLSGLTSRSWLAKAHPQTRLPFRR
jgi:hypothetical protein